MGPIGGCGANGGKAKGVPPRDHDSPLMRSTGKTDGWGRGASPPTGGARSAVGPDQGSGFRRGHREGGILERGRSVTDRFISESSAAAATGVTTAAASTKSGFPSAVRDQLLLSSGPVTY